MEGGDGSQELRDGKEEGNVIISREQVGVEEWTRSDGEEEERTSVLVEREEKREGRMDEWMDGWADE